MRVVAGVHMVGRETGFGLLELAQRRVQLRQQVSPRKIEVADAEDDQEDSVDEDGRRARGCWQDRRVGKDGRWYLALAFHLE
jgi:hypothetical protein